MRQLAYEFRDWVDIQAVGRTGTDEGSDSRAYELLPGPPVEHEDAESESLPVGRRLWIIQCKRKTTFGPSDSKRVIGEIRLGADEAPYGLIVAVPSNISLATRRTFAEAARRRGFEEFYLWGKGELEDQLLLPRNDHLLFGYFGISLQVRRRSIRTEQRSLVALKRQLVKALGDVSSEHYEEVLLRSPGDPQYPLIKDPKRFRQERSWWYYRFVEHWPPDQLVFEIMRFPAFVNLETDEWDAIFDYDMLQHHHQGLWGLEPDRSGDEWQGERRAQNLERERYMRFYEDLPENQRATLSLFGLVPYERVLAIDELGDRVNRPPHLVVLKNPAGDFFDPYPFVSRVEQPSNRVRREIFAHDEKRIQHFPKSFPKITQAQYDTIKEKRRKVWEKNEETNKKE